MTAKTRILCAVVFLALGVGSWWFFLSPAVSLRTSGDRPRADEKATEEEGAAPWILEPDGRAHGARVTRDADPLEAAAGGTEVLPPEGRLRFTLADSVSGDPLGGAEVRLHTGTRFAELHVAGPTFGLTLSAGLWKVRASVVGYEDAVFESRVPPGDEFDRGAVTLDRGNGRIDGRVTLREAFLSPWILVELTGVGRNSCSRCGEEPGKGPPPEASEPAGATEVPEELAGACPHCGWAEESSILARRGSGTFAFRNLASGTYLLRARTRAYPRGVVQYVQVEPHGSAWADLFLVDAVELDFSLRHESGEPFIGPPDESRPGSGAVLPAQFLYRFWQGDAEVAQASLIPPNAREAIIRAKMLADAEAMNLLLENYERTFLFSIEKQQELLRERSQLLVESRLDRRRTEGDSLRVDRSRPALETTVAGARFLAPHLHRIQGLPAQSVTVTCECGEWRSRPVSIDLYRKAGSTRSLTMVPPSAVGQAP